MQSGSAAHAIAGKATGVRSDKRRHQRVKISLLGRYMLADRREFPCQTIDMSPGGVALAAPMRAELGERVVVYLDNVGRIEGKVSRHMEDGFALELNVPLRKREKLADQLTWLANRAALGMPEDRRHERIEPRIRRATMRMENGEEYPVKLIDVSLSGAAMHVTIRPKMGALVTVGETVGRVVRHFDGGIALEFTRLLPEAHFDEDIKL